MDDLGRDQEVLGVERLLFVLRVDAGVVLPLDRVDLGGSLSPGDSRLLESLVGEGSYMLLLAGFVHLLLEAETRSREQLHLGVRPGALGHLFSSQDLRVQLSVSR